MQGCEEKEGVLLLWERALTLFYENDTELFVAGAQERTIAGKIAMHMDKISEKVEDECTEECTKETKIEEVVATKEKSQCIWTGYTQSSFKCLDW